MSQSINFFAGIHGHASPQPMVTTASNGANCFISSSDFDLCPDKSYPNCFIETIAFGFIVPDGFEPALYASASLPRIFTSASAICERLLFSTQTKRIFFFMQGFSPSRSPMMGKRMKTQKWFLSATGRLRDQLPDIPG